MFKLFWAIISPITQVAPPFEQTNYTCPKAICVQYLRILFSIFREEDFQKFCNLLCSAKMPVVGVYYNLNKL